MARLVAARTLPVTLTLLFLPPSILAAQDTTAVQPTPTVSLTLAEALQTATANSPDYRSALNDAGPARWGVRNAWASAVLPSASVSTGMGYSGAGSSTFGGTEFRQTSPTLTSDYSIGLSWELNGQTLTAPGRAKANQRSVTENIAGAGVQLRANVTRQYLLALQNEAQVVVAREQVSRNEDFVRLAQARYDVGQATLLDVRQAQVTKGTSDVALLQARQAAADAKLELFRLMGIEIPADPSLIALPDSFPVSDPAWDLETLLATADEQNPEVRAAAAREDAASSQLTAAKAQYLPRLSVSAGWSGFAQEFTDEELLLSGQLAGAQGGYAACLDNNVIRSSAGLSTNNCLASNGLIDPNTLDPNVVSAFRENNNVFPFNYTRSPFGASLTISLPIFTGFSRQLQVAEAGAAREDADEAHRAQRLLVRSRVRSRFAAVNTAHSSIAVQAAARDAAREQLRLAQDRYRVGSGTALELADAQAAVQRAEGDYVNAVYSYHIAIADLEAAVGRPLR